MKYSHILVASFSHWPLNVDKDYDKFLKYHSMSFIGHMILNHHEEFLGLSLDSHGLFYVCIDVILSA